MRLAWATDIHLDHASESARCKFCQSVKEQADALVVTGDIAESRILGSALTALAALTERPVYFVLGNHDFYRGSIADTRRQVAYVVGDTEGLVYLSESGVLELTPNTALIGHDGWADGKRRTANPRPTRRGHTKGDFTDICLEITAPFSVPLLAVATQQRA
jgi:predicted MPP superfamily phosphohydrolase